MALGGGGGALWGGGGGHVQKNPRAHKNKIGTSPPPPQKPPLKRGILWTWVFLQKERIFSRRP